MDFQFDEKKLKLVQRVLNNRMLFKIVLLFQVPLDFMTVEGRALSWWCRIETSEDSREEGVMKEKSRGLKENKKAQQKSLKEKRKIKKEKEKKDLWGRT